MSTSETTCTHRDTRHVIVWGDEGSVELICESCGVRLSGPTQEGGPTESPDHGEGDAKATIGTQNTFQNDPCDHAMIGGWCRKCGVVELKRREATTPTQKEIQKPELDVFKAARLRPFQHAKYEATTQTEDIEAALEKASIAFAKSLHQTVVDIVRREYGK